MSAAPTPPSPPLQLDPQTVRRILVCHVARIGDTILTTPALRLLSETYPQAKIDFLGHPKRYQVLNNLPYLNKIGAISKQRAPFMGRWPALFKKKEYDFAVVWGHDAAIAWYACRVSRHVVIQKLNADEINHKLTINGCQVISLGAAPNTVTEPNSSLLMWRMALLQQSTLCQLPHINQCSADYVVSHEELIWAKEWLYNKFADATLVGLVMNTHPVGKVVDFPEREWPEENYIELCKRILSLAPNIHFIVFGDKHATFKLRGVPENNIYYAANEFNIRQSAAIISQLSLYIGADTGPTHIAVALSVPTIAIFHSYLNGTMVLAPKDHDKTCIIDHPCKDKQKMLTASMADLDVDQVWQKAQLFIEKYLNH